MTIAFLLKCSIDLKENVLKIGTTGTVTKFLPESELPECARLSGNANQEMEDQDLAEALNRSTQDASSSIASSAPAGQSTSRCDWEIIFISSE
jgi:DNA damage-inducible protein 1